MIDFEIISEVVAAAYARFGQQAPRNRSLTWRTEIVSKDGSAEQRNQVNSLPEPRGWNLNWKWLDETAEDKLIEIFHRARGSFETFKLKCWKDFVTTTEECIITAAGGETTTQLIKSYYPTTSETWDENRTLIVPDSQAVFRDVGAGPVKQLEGAGENYTLDDDTGIITWVSPAALGAGDIITASFEFYFQVRFDFETFDDEEHYRDFWKTNGVDLIEVRGG